MIDLSIEVANPSRYGWKAHYLSRMINAGFSVPDAVAIAPDDDIDISVLDVELGYAVRSSGLAEDGSAASYAGHFLTELSVSGADALCSAIAAVRESSAGEMPMGVVVQQMVLNPTLSGVAFSFHPITFDPNVGTVSWVRGLGDALVSGSDAGNDVTIRLSDGTLASGTWPLDDSLLKRIADALLHLEGLLGQPVDIEWCITDQHELFLLQVRPVVLPRPAVINLDTAGAFIELPGPIKTHSKIALRLDAAALEVPMSPARIIIGTRHAGLPTLMPFLASKRSAGRSVVLLQPPHIEGRVIREFAMDCSTDVEFFVRGCQRYAIRQYPEQSAAVDAVTDILAVGLSSSPIACVIEQEILHAYATGILRQTDDGYLVEIALGHFVPKGYVETSTFVLSGDLDVTFRSTTPQSKAYHFINGHVVTETPPYEPLALSDADLSLVVRTLRPILDKSPGVSLEFGILGRPGDVSAYMIDIADADGGSLSASDMTRGIVSSGSATGRVVDLRESEAHDDLNAHLHDAALSGTDPDLGPTIYIARSASVDLLPLVRACGPSCGFIFERASLLAHLSVVLREQGIAAATLSSSVIDALLTKAHSLRLDTGSDEVVTVFEETSSS